MDAKNEKLGKEIGDGRLDTFLRILHLISKAKGQSLSLDCHKVEEITPAGYAILACIFDYALEQGCKVELKNLASSFSKTQVIQNLLNLSQFSALPKANIHDSDQQDWILRGRSSGLSGDLAIELESNFSLKISEDLLFTLQLLTNELMLNSVDHSTAERYYWYAGLYQKEFHLGILDLGVTIPAKLSQKYVFKNDTEAIALALKHGVSTRRNRAGGLGLFNTALCLKEEKGRLTILSGQGSLRYYFKRRKKVKMLLKYRLPGTWCFTRFPLAN